jgi:putative tryptophan/tyrosine transport system substrate-binding protein
MRSSRRQPEINRSGSKPKASAKTLKPMIAYTAQSRFSTGETMRRREFIALMGASVVWPFAAMAQQAGRTYRLGALLPLTRDAPVNAAFLDEFRRRGFSEGQNLTVEWRAYGQNSNLISQYASDLVEGRVDVIVTTGDHVIRALQHATKAIPIVAITDDMLAFGHVKSLARPEGNTTGVNILAHTLDGKRQEILLEVVPGLRRMAALADANIPNTNLDELRKAARAHNVELSIYHIARGEELEAAIDRAQTSGATALNVLASPLLYANGRLIMDRVAALRLPAMYAFPEDAEEGGLAAYGPRLNPLFVEVMPQQIIELFRGVKVADIPVQQPTKIELVINLKTAKAMGVTVPEALLVRADKVIE